MNLIVNKRLTFVNKRLTSLSRELMEALGDCLLQVNIGRVGEIKKIRLEHDNRNPNPAWHVESVSRSNTEKSCQGHRAKCDTGETLLYGHIRNEGKGFL